MSEGRSTESVRIKKDVLQKVDDVRGDLSRGDMVANLIDKGLKQGNGSSFELDDQTKQAFFKHLGSGKEEYKQSLVGLELTERELVDLALEKSGKRYGDLLRQALISVAKEEITLAARREYQDTEGVGSPEKRLQDAFAELNNLMFEGKYRPRGGRLNISAVAQRARVNFGTAKKWAELNQPELL